MKKIISLCAIFAIICTLVLGAFNFTVSAGDGSTDGHYSFRIDNNVAVITKVNTAISGDVIIPETLGDFPVGVIGEEAFKGCTKITSVVLPETVTIIEASAFEGCSKLESITLPNKIATIGANAFKGCSKLTDVTYYGTEDDKANIEIGKGNSFLEEATWKFIPVEPTPTETPKPTKTPTPTKKPTPTPTEEPTPEITPVPDNEKTPNLTWFWFVIGGVVVAAIGTLVVFLIVNKKKSEE